MISNIFQRFTIIPNIMHISKIKIYAQYKIKCLNHNVLQRESLM